MRFRFCLEKNSEPIVGEEQGGFWNGKVFRRPGFCYCASTGGSCREKESKLHKDLEKA